MQIKRRNHPYQNFLLIFPESTQPAFKTGTAISLLASLISGVSFIFLQPVIPLFYSLAQANKQLQPKIWIFLYPILSLLILFFHFTILSKARNLAPAVQKIFAWSTVGVITILTILLTRTVMILF